MDKPIWLDCKNFLHYSCWESSEITIDTYKEPSNQLISNHSCLRTDYGPILQKYYCMGGALVIIE